MGDCGHSVLKNDIKYSDSEKKKKKKLIQLSLHPWPPRRWMQGRVWMHSAKKIKLFYNIQYRDTWHSWFTMFFLWRGLEQHVFSRGRMGCAWLPLSVSPEKCSLISSQLAATQGQRSIDNQSILQLVNCPGCWLGALGALSTSAGRDNSSSPPPLLLFLLPFSFFWRVSDPLHEYETELAFMASGAATAHISHR